jgi:hypothetical protein
MVEFQTAVEEIFSFELLSKLRFPEAMGFQQDTIRHTFIVPSEDPPPLTPPPTVSTSRTSTPRSAVHRPAHGSFVNSSMRATCRYSTDVTHDYEAVLISSCILIAR